MINIFPILNQKLESEAECPNIEKEETKIDMNSIYSEQDIRNSFSNNEDQETLLPITSLPRESYKSKHNLFASVFSCVLYSVCSVSMVLTNKVISTSVADKAHLPQYSIILFQCLLATIFVEAAKYFNFVEYAPFNMNIAKAWLPLNFLFIGMLCTGFFSLVYVSVPMVTIFKNLTNLVTVFGDWYLFHEKYTFYFKF